MTDKQTRGSVAGVGPRLFFVRGHKVMLDEDLAALYELGKDELNLVVANHVGSFPEGYMFQLNPEEFADLKLQVAVSGKAAPYAFTGQGLALLSSILFDNRVKKGDVDSCAPSCGCNC